MIKGNKMAKAIKTYFGNDSYGRGVEMSQREDGVWFDRFREFNGYANAWCKWSKCEDEPVFETESKNPHNSETIKFPEPIMYCGFTRMYEGIGHSEGCKYRLPNE